jgi:murein DD-endopeptidase MepM/ murein hydrolase activator NlpD
VGGNGQFGPYRKGGPHQGVDIAGQSGVTPVLAARAGVVERSNYSTTYGNVVVISSGADAVSGPITTLYAHMTNGSLAVQVGDLVIAGQTLGIVGQTGMASRLLATEAHVHFEVSVGGPTYLGGTAIDPGAFLSEPCDEP